MAKLEANLTVKAGQDKEYLCSMNNNYTEVYQDISKVDNSDGFVLLASLAKTNTSILKGSKLLIIKNNSPVGVEVQLKITEYKNNSNAYDVYNSVDISGSGASPHRYVSYAIASNQYIVLPTQYFVAYANDASAANSKTVDNEAGYDTNATLSVTVQYTTAGGGGISTTDILVDGAISDSATTLTVDNGDYFRVNDIIKIGSEILEITAISTNDLTVKRGAYGSTAASIADDAPIKMPFFNTTGNHDKYTYAQTDGSGRYKAPNLFGYGRTISYNFGIVKGSFAMKFYNNGYQELGMSGVTPNTESGLAASTTYGMNITVDGGTEFVDLSFTTDASNTKFGGNNGVLSKIQSALDTQFYTSGNLFEKGVTVSIVNGDIRFASTNRTRVSAISLANAGSATNFFGVGRIPAVGSIEGAIAAKLPDDTVFDDANYIETKNQAVFAYDDGKGNIVGAATGTINYESGAIDFTGPANAEFAASFNYNSAHSGGIRDENLKENSVSTISARSMNSKVNAEVELLGFV